MEVSSGEEYYIASDNTGTPLAVFSSNGQMIKQVTRTQQHSSSDSVVICNPSLPQNLYLWQPFFCLKNIFVQNSESLLAPGHIFST